MLPPRIVAGSLKRACASLLLGTTMLFLQTWANAALAAPATKDSGGNTSGNSVISGVVRDAQGVVQMGALVQVLGANATTIAMAFTDQHGHYSIPNLKAGKYLVRASATLFVPATKTNLQLRTGATAIVNLTLSALFDTAAWLPAQRRKADETADDWKWTLRSTANRPILRIIEDGEAIEVSSSASDVPGMIRAKALGAVESGDGGFGQGGVHTIETIHRGLDDGSDLMLRADMGTTTQGGAAQASNEFDLGYEGRTGFAGGASRTVVSYKAHPELVGTGIEPDGSSGLEVMEVTSAQRMSLGERVEVQTGGRMEAVHAGRSAVATHPFLRVSAHPSGSWTLEYKLATDRGLQEFGDVTSGDGDVPVALVEGGKLRLESGRHQELSASRREGRTSIQVAFYSDLLRNVAVAGGEAAGPAPDSGTTRSELGAALLGAPVRVQSGLVLDPITGSFRALAAGYKANGLRLEASSALTPSLWIAAAYSSGAALASGDTAAGPVSVQDALAGLAAEHSQTATLALKGKVVKTGTRVRASYRWQPLHEVTAVDPYSAFGDQAYLSCMMRQSIKMGHLVPQGLEATIDVTNLLAQGYRPFVSADGQTLYFAQAPRSVQAGLSFSF